MQLRHCRASRGLRRHDTTAISNAIRGFHISARRGEESNSNSSGNSPRPLVSARARSAAASAQIQSLKPGARLLTPRPREQQSKPRPAGLAGGAFPSGQNAPRMAIRRVPMDRDAAPQFQARVDRLTAAQRPGGRARGGRRGEGGEKRKRGRREQQKTKKKEEDVDEEDEAGMSDTMLRYLLQLRAERRAVKNYTPHQATAAELVGAGSSSLGQPSGATLMLEERLRLLAERKQMAPVGLLLQARRLVHGKFVKFADEQERDAVLAVVAENQERIAAMLSEKKGEEIAPKAIEFAEVEGAPRQQVTDKIIAGRYQVQQGDDVPNATGRALDLNGTYVGLDKEKFMNRFSAILAVKGRAQKPQAA